MELPLRNSKSEIGSRTSRWTIAEVALAGSYVLLGTVLVLSRLVGLGQSLWLDELRFVGHFVRSGPREILTGPALSHELYGLIDWATAAVIGESDIAFRLWSAIPFILGVALVTAWLHRRHDPLAGVLFLFLATVSPLLLDITRQARGYGLAFLAMAVLVVAALETSRSGRVTGVIVMCVAGVVGSWTLPQFGMAFLPMLAVLLLDRRLRWPAAIGLVASTVAIYAFYAPHTKAVEASATVEVGANEIPTTWLVTAPIDQIVLPALIWIDGAKIPANVGWLPFVLAAVVVMASSPLVRRRIDWALILCIGPVATVVVLRVIQAYVAPRYFSYLLVPTFLLLATGAAAIFRRIPERRALVRAAVCIVAIVALAANFARLARDVVSLPREANRDAAELIESRSPRTTPVYATVPDPLGLEFYLDRPFRTIEGSRVASRICESDGPLVYVMQPWRIGPVDVSCLQRPGVEHYRFEQYARGDEMNVWLVPPQP